jgi:hypothetical protein
MKLKPTEEWPLTIKTEADMRPFTGRLATLQIQPVVLPDLQTLLKCEDTFSSKSSVIKGEPVDDLCHDHINKSKPVSCFASCD